MVDQDYSTVEPASQRRSPWRKLVGTLRLFGLDFSRAAGSIRGLPKFIRDYRTFRRLSAADQSGFPIQRILPILDDHLFSAGTVSSQYFHQDLYVARRIFECSPKRHIDIGSRIDGLVSHVAVFRQIEVIDIRPLSISARNIIFLQADLQNLQVAGRIGKADSVSCLNAVEHFGLGRYGDMLQVDGHLQGIHNITRLVVDGGLCYLSVPIGPQRVEFNAHRVFAARTIPEFLKNEFRLERFSFVDDVGEFHENVSFALADATQHFGCYFGCGIYELRRVPQLGDRQ